MCLYRDRKFAGSAVPWNVELDGSRVGVVSNGEVACFPGASGTRSLRVTHPMGTMVPVGTVALMMPAPTTAIDITVPPDARVHVYGHFAPGGIALEVVDAAEAARIEAEELKPRKK